MTEILIEKIKELISKYDVPEPLPDDFNPGDNGNFDDAYELGYERGEQEVADDVRKILESEQYQQTPAPLPLLEALKLRVEYAAMRAETARDKSIAKGDATFTADFDGRAEAFWEAHEWVKELLERQKA